MTNYYHLSRPISVLPTININVNFMMIIIAIRMTIKQVLALLLSTHTAHTVVLSYRSIYPTVEYHCRIITVMSIIAKIL